MKEEVEAAIADEASKFCDATLDINPYSEAEVLELGTARAVYTGVISAVHGVYGLGLDGPVEERDILEIEKFYARKERTPRFWVSDFADSSLLEFLGKYEITQTQIICGQEAKSISIAATEGNNAPDLNQWASSFSKIENPLAAQTRVHQKNLRFYLNESKSTFTFFSGNIAFIPFVQRELFPKQVADIKKFQTKFVVNTEEGFLPKIYERKLYERI